MNDDDYYTKIFYKHGLPVLIKILKNKDEQIQKLKYSATIDNNINWIAERFIHSCNIRNQVNYLETMISYSRIFDPDMVEEWEKQLEEEKLNVKKRLEEYKKIEEE